MKKTMTSMLAVSLLAGVSLCFAGDDLKTGIGGGLGGAAGAAIGDKMGGDKGAIIGGAAGGAIGAAATTEGSGKKGAIVGGAVGGAAGAAVGQRSGGKNGAVLGAGVGGAAGAVVGKHVTQKDESQPVTQAVAVRSQPQASVVNVADSCEHRPHGKAKGWYKNHPECEERGEHRHHGHD